MTPPRNGLLLFLILLAPGGTALAGESLPTWLPRYDLDVRIDVREGLVHVRQQVAWTNRHQRPAGELVFNAHSRYLVPDGEVGFLAKTLEILRINPADSITRARALDVRRAYLPSVPDQDLPIHFGGDTDTDLIVELPAPVGSGETVTVALEFTLQLPQKFGRWGQWRGVTYLSNWLPVVAVYDDDGWHPTAFIPWHQPFFNEAGTYSARVVVPADQKVACTGSVTAVRQLPDGCQELSIAAPGVRDFALLCSASYVVHEARTPETPFQPPVRVRVLALPGHEHYANEMLRIACEAIPTYARWFGPYPWPDFTITEAFFGWNGNECSTLVMIDERIFAMPHMADRYVDYLVSHEICHQWWYNLVGTNGYCETWMDEALAVHFSHKLTTQKYGKNNEMLRFPRGLEWLPNIRREDYRASGLMGTIGRGENGPVVQEMPKFSHVVNLFSMCYDKGSKIVGIIEDRLGETAFFDFMRIVHARYRYRILRVADFQKELENYTGQSWDEFFRHWVYGHGLSDWAVDDVRIEKYPSPLAPRGRGVGSEGECSAHPVKAVVTLCQKLDCCEPTVLGIALCKDDGYEIRIPVVPQAPRLEVPELNAVVESLPDGRVRVEVLLPSKPKQIAVDPDQVLVDKVPANNYWKKPVRFNATPLYTTLDETDLTNAHDRLNINCGPWFYRPSYDDPWYTRSTLIGARIGGYKTQEFSGGLYTAYRTDYRDVVVGADALFLHCPWSQTQLGFNVEQRLVGFQDGRDTALRASVYGRYVIQYGSSLYLPPMKYAEGFATYQDNFLPNARDRIPGAQRYDSLLTGGVHYHVDHRTPYWDPSCGLALDLTYAGGTVELDEGQRAAHQFAGQFTYITTLPDLSGHAGAFDPVLRWLGDSRLALRVYGAGGLPDEVEYFPLGGGSLFRGYDQAQRQGSLVWVGNVEWRLPILKDVQCDICDHTIGARNVYGALFYDVGDAYTRGRSPGSVAHAVGLGMRMELAIFSFIERMTLRVDAAKTVNDNTPWQFWFGLQHPF